VAASDRMISSGGIIRAADNGTLKARKIAKTWALMFAADDANLFLPVVTTASASLKEKGQFFDLHTVQDIILTTYMGVFDAEVTSHYLNRYNIASITAFRDSGLSKFGQDRFNSICDAIDRFDLGLVLLVYGYDTAKQPHIFEVSNPGKITNHDLLGYAAIGSGSYTATAALRRKKLPYELNETVYRVLEAKFSAETAPGVGRSITLLTMNQDGKDGTIGYGSLEAIKEVWAKTLEEPEPPEAISIISKLTVRPR
jgi:Proteasome subunit